MATADNCADELVGEAAREELLALLKQHPQGLKEYDLFKLLHARLPEAERPDIADSLVLFQQHFLLFHALYQLRDQLHAEQSGHLLIDALLIQWLPYDQSQQHDTLLKQGRIEGQQLASSDPLRDYYLDRANFTATGRSQVDELLSSFWSRLGKLTPVDEQDQQQALDVLGLEADTDFSTIKRRYRQLLSEHHPDKGGCHEKAQALNEAMAVLKQAYQAA